MPDRSLFIHKTSLGQNFLVDRNILDKIMEYADISPEDVILEVGSGMGVLTKKLAESGCRKVYSLEIDRRLEKYLDPLQKDFINLSIIWADAVKFDYSHELSLLPTRMIANIPYHITTPLLWKVISTHECRQLKYFLLMVQKEAALRICAGPGTKERYPLGITIEALGKARIIHRIPPQAFRPIPKVESALLEIRLERTLDDINEPDIWRKTLRTAFAQRRKKLVNNIAPLMETMDKQKIQTILEALGIDAGSRAEHLTTNQWLQFYKSIKDDIKR